MSLISGVPVSARSSGRAVRARIFSERLQDVLGALGLLVLDEVGLVDHHRAEAELPQPADVAVEDLVVDDHDVGEAVDVVAVAVDHGDLAVGRPDRGLARPVGLHDVGDDGEQRERVGGLRGEQRLRGLAEARLVGEQEGAVPVGRGLDQLGLVEHQLAPRGHPDVARLGQRHARRAPAVLEGAEQRTEQLPGREPARLGPALVGGGEVGDEERVGEPPLDDGLGDHPAIAGEQLGLVRLGLLLLLELHAGGRDHLAAQLLGGVGDGGVLGEQGEQRGVAGRGLGQDRGHAVEPLELVGLLGLGELGVGLDPGPLLADQERDDLELGARGRRDRPALGARLDLAYGAREDRNDALVVAVPAPVALAGLGPAVTGLALASSGQGLPFDCRGPPWPRHC